MKAITIFNVLDVARKARALGKKFNPLFVGPPGLGKSEIVQEWCNKKGLPFIDLRAAYLEAPDVIGFPSIETKDGRQVTVHNTPDFWPQDPNWEGVILLEEPNRGTTSIMNTFMQLLTDRKVHKYSLPEKALIVGCINPEGDQYDVNTMDSALKDRFEIYEISYDKKSFVQYMKATEWEKDIIHFVESNTWSYVRPEDIKNVPGAKYISPRTLSKLDALLKAGFETEDETMHYSTVLGNNVGKDFYAFRHNESPVVYSDLVNNTKGALSRLKQFSDTKNLKSGMIAIFIQDVLDCKDISDELLVKVLEVLPVDQGTVLIRDLSYVRKDNTLLNRICSNNKNIKELFKNTLTYGSK